MGEIKRIITVLFFLCIFFSLYETPEAKFTFNGYETWSMKDVNQFHQLGDDVQTIDGKNYKITGVQGMNVGTKYIYTAKIYTGSDNYNLATIYRTTISNKSTVKMSCTSSCSHAEHANDLLVVTDINSINHMLVATNNKEHAIASYKINGTSLTFTGYFKVVTSNGTEITCSAVRLYRHDKKTGIYYLLFKNKETIYHGIIKENQITGNKTPIVITAYKIAILDRKNGVFVNNSGFENYYNMETWVNQGFTYNSKEKTIYVPYFMPKTGTYITTSAILMYYVGDVFTKENIEGINSNKNKNHIIFSTKTSFLFKASGNYNGLEVESSGFNNDVMYINANAFPDQYDAIFSVNYKLGTGKYTSILSISNIYYTVKYDGNGGKDEGANDVNGNYKMEDTRHIYDLKSNLRPNKFSKEGYIFKGWHLSRESDSKKLYGYTENGQLKYQWCTDAQHQENTVNCRNLALYSDKQTVSRLSKSNGDVVTAKAVWSTK